ncbi:extracellular solute-binding protein [Paenibacillus sp. GYB004]|uniref:extracellular solute-binding protein n=1 Tax=Paenibacillus sp. GYB004 TaxID=2994393 RepID=UPI002F9662BF
MKPKRTTSRSRLEEMIAVLKDDILTGKRSEGEFLPSELDLGEMYTLSKNTVRKGLDVLVSEGFIEKVPRIGARVIRKKQKTGELIRFGYYPTMNNEMELLELVERFNEANPDVQVEPVPVVYPRDYEAVQKYLREGTLLDIMTINLYNYEFIRGDSPEKSVLEPLEPRDDLYPFLNAPFQSGDRQYLLPFVFTPVVLCYNKDHFREAELAEPDSGWTWDDLSAAADKLAAGGDRLGFYFHLMSENRWPIFLLQNGVRFGRREDGSRIFSAPLVKEALEACMNIVNAHFPYHLSEDDNDAVSLFLNGKASMIIATYSCLNALKGASFEYDIAPLPHLKELKTMLVVIGLGINKMSAHKDAAKRFADYLLSYETQLHIRKQTLNLPSVKRAAEWTGEEEVKRRPYRFHMYREIIHTFRTYADLNISVQDMMAMRNELRYYWSKLESLDTVLERLDQQS